MELIKKLDPLFEILYIGFFIFVIAILIGGIAEHSMSFAFILSAFLGAGFVFSKDQLSVE